MSLLGEPQDAGAHPAHAEDRQAAEELSDGSRHRSRRGHGTAHRARFPASRAAGNGWRPAVDALATHGRVITFSLCDERDAVRSRAIRSAAFENYVDAARRRRWIAPGSTQAVIVGVSYGGLIAAEFAARHPERVAGAGARLGAARATGQPDRRQRRYLKSPLADEPAVRGDRAGRACSRRCAPRCRAIGARLRFMAGTRRCASSMAPTSPAEMARRLALGAGASLRGSARASTCTALVVTGEPALDQRRAGRCDASGTWTSCNRPSTSCSSAPATSAS